MIYAVIDTNVFVAALLTKHRDAATAKVVEAVVAGRITAGASMGSAPMDIHEARPSLSPRV